MRVIATSILSESSTGCICAAIDADGRALRLNISSTNGLRIAVGCSYEVEGPEETYVDSRLDKHRQIRVTRIERQQTTGLLVGKWLEQLPHLGATRAKRLLDFFGDNVLDALSDPLRAEEVAAVIDPVRPALARRIAVAVMSATVSRQGEESIERMRPATSP